jgi:arylformamidase
MQPTYFDISLPLTNGMPIYPRNPKFTCAPHQRMADGGTSNVSRIEMGTHTGTHVDAPLHLLDGAPGVESLAMSSLIGPTRVIDVANSAVPFNRDQVEAQIAGASRVLFKTRNSERIQHGNFEFFPDYVAMDPEVAEVLVEHAVVLVGIDSLSIERYGAVGRPTHETLLRAGIVILEGLDLSEVTAGDYTLMCLPLRIVGVDGAPARAVLMK